MWRHCPLTHLTYRMFLKDFCLTYFLYQSWKSHQKWSCNLVLDNEIWVKTCRYSRKMFAFLIKGTKKDWVKIMLPIPPILYLEVNEMPATGCQCERTMGVGGKCRRQPHIVRASFLIRWKSKLRVVFPIIRFSVMDNQIGYRKQDLCVCGFCVFLVLGFFFFETPPLPFAFMVQFLVIL